jgi:hypothetical protein
VSQVEREGHLQFEFGPSWHRVRWDKDKAFQKGIRLLQHEGGGSKGVDFLAVHEKLGVCFLEVTDGRGDAQFVKTIDNEALFAEVGFKVRDSLAGLVGTLCNDGRNEQKWEPFRRPLEKGHFSVILWVEHEMFRHTSDPELGVLTDSLRKYVQWLTHRRVIITNTTRGWADLVPDLKVLNLPGAGQV